ncbi:MAG: hypothetical protein ACJAYC_002435 [Halieaceae bacterium]|jgi:hypothetical protein
MKLIIIPTVAALVVASSLALAESDRNGSGKHNNHQRHAAHLQQKFGVSDDQLAQMREIRENGGSREDAKAVLSDSQQNQMDQWRQNHPRGHKGQRSESDE